MELLEQEYFSKINLNEKDIFQRLRQACLLKIQLMKKHPWIFDFIRVVVFTDSDVVKDELDKRRKKMGTSIFEGFYGDIDTSLMVILTSCEKHIIYDECNRNKKAYEVIWQT